MTESIFSSSSSSTFLLSCHVDRFFRKYFFYGALHLSIVRAAAAAATATTTAAAAAAATAAAAAVIRAAGSGIGHEILIVFLSKCWNLCYNQKPSSRYSSLGLDAEKKFRNNPEILNEFRK